MPDFQNLNSDCSKVNCINNTVVATRIRYRLFKPLSFLCPGGNGLSAKAKTSLLIINTTLFGKASNSFSADLFIFR